MNRLTKYHIASFVFLVVFVLGTAVAADAKEMTFADMVYYMGCLIMELCAVRHPLGHAALFDWRLPAVHAAALSGVQWVGIAATGAIVAVWMKRR